MATAVPTRVLTPAPGAWAMTLLMLVQAASQPWLTVPRANPAAVSCWLAWAVVLPATAGTGTASGSVI